MNVLILGGTGEARELAAALVDDGIEVTSSLAGRVARPRLPVGKVRIGGFGGVDGLRAALCEYDVVIDATHPFATGMSANAAAACHLEQVPLLRLERPGWVLDPAWRQVEGHEDAALLAAQLGRRPFLTVGRQELARFVPALRDLGVLARVVDSPDLTPPSAWQIVHSRGPYTLEGELATMREHGSDVLVTKNSGGSFTWPKMLAAARLGVPVIVIARPPASDGVHAVSSVSEALTWLSGRSGPTPQGPGQPPHDSCDPEPDDPPGSTKTPSGPAYGP